MKRCNCRLRLEGLESRALLHAELGLASYDTPDTIFVTDDHGDDASTATAISVNSRVSGRINADSDVDWFRFEATHGSRYAVETRLGTLPDSVLALVDRDGITFLSYNDDYDGLASRIEVRQTRPHKTRPEPKQ